MAQEHNAIDRKLFAMKGFHHPVESSGVSHRARAPYNLIPYQRRPCSTQV